MSVVRVPSRSPWVHGTPFFAAAAVLGGVAVAGVVEGIARSPTVSLGAIAAALIVVVSIQRLTFGLVVLVALTYSNGFIVIKDHGDVPSAAFPFAVLIVVFAFFARERDEPFLPRSADPAIGAFAVYGAWLVASAAWAKDPDLALRTAGAYWKLMLMVLAVLVLVRTPRALVIVIWTIVAAAAILAAMAVVQRFYPSLRFFGFAQPTVHELTSTGEATRSVGPIGNANGFAQTLVVAVPLAFGRILCERRLLLRHLAALTIVLCAITIYLTFSRGGFVGLAIVLVLCFVRYRPRLAALILGAALVLIVFEGVGSYGSRLGTLRQALPWYSSSKISDPSIKGRSAFLRAGLHMWREHPLGGVGYANYAIGYVEYNRTVGTDPTLGNSAHDTPVEVLSETGAIGLVLWIVLFLAAFTSLWDTRRSVGEDRRLCLTVDFLGLSLVGYLVTALFVGGAYSILAWLLLAICFSARAALGPAAGLTETLVGQKLAR